MKFLSQSLAFLGILASFAATANADCKADIMESANIDTITEFTGLYIIEQLKTITGDQPDYTGMKTLCEENDEMDYFTFSFTQTCVDGTGGEIISEMKDSPVCYPSSCTSDVDALKITLADNESDLCTSSGLTFSGLETTSGSGSFRASIAGSVLMLAVASALL